MVGCSERMCYIHSPGLLEEFFRCLCPNWITPKEGALHAGGSPALCEWLSGGGRRRRAELPGEFSMAKSGGSGSEYLSKPGTHSLLPPKVPNVAVEGGGGIHTNGTSPFSWSSAFRILLLTDSLNICFSATTSNKVITVIVGLFHYLFFIMSPSRNTL